MHRREFGKTVAGAALAASVLYAQRTEAASKRLEVGMLLYPGLTLLDLIGPHTVLGQFANIHLVWKSHDPISSDTGVVVQPTATFSECPADLDVLFVPGGRHMTALNEPAALAFLAERGARAAYVTSVCSGSIVLGAAGLLAGYKATSHWGARDLLPLFGAEPVEARVVVDRNRVTGGGITAGIDFGLVLLAKLRGDEAAKLTQLVMKYDPQPPFDAGTPRKAGAERTQRVARALEPINRATREFAARRKAGA